MEPEISSRCSILQSGSVQGHSSQHLKRRLPQVGKEQPTKLRVVGSEAQSLETAANLVGSHRSVRERWPGFQQSGLREGVVTSEAPRLHCGVRCVQGSAADSRQTPDALAVRQPSVRNTQHKSILYPSHFSSDEQACVDLTSPIVQAAQPGSQVPTRPAIVRKVCCREKCYMSSHELLIH